MKRLVGLCLCLSLSIFTMARAMKPTHTLAAEEQEVAAKQDASEESASGDDSMEDASDDEGEDMSDDDASDDDHLLRIAGNDPQLQAQSDKTWELFDNAFKKEFPKVLVPNVDDKPSIEYLADKAKLKPFYDSHYRIYSRYTHGAVHASTGNIDKATDCADNQIMAVCALVALDNLISLGAKSSNRDRLAQRLSGIS
jgi:vancomycin resistance protein YoaR